MNKINTYLLILILLSIILPFHQLIGQNNKETIQRYHESALRHARSNQDSAFYFQKLALQFMSKNNGWALATNKSVEARIEMLNRDDANAYLNYMKALDLYDKIDTLDLYNKYVITRNIGTILRRNSQFERAIDYYQKALNFSYDLLKITEDKKTQTKFSQVIYDIPIYQSMCHNHLGKPNKAIELLIKLLNQPQIQDQKTAQADVLLRIGLLSKNYGRHNEANKYLKKVLSLDDISEYELAQANHNLANNSLIQEQYKESEQYFLEAIAQMDQIIASNAKDSYRRQLFISHLDLGEVYFRQSRYQQAIDEWHTAILAYDDLKGRPDFYIIHNWLLKAYLEAGTDLDKAKEHNALFIKYNQDFLATREKLADALNQSLFTNQLARYEEAQTQEAVRAQTKKTYSAYLIIVAILAIAAIIFLIWYLVYKRGNTLYRLMLKAAQKE